MLSIERNLNPKVACLKKRDEEKGDDPSRSPMLLGPTGDMSQQANLAGEALAW